MKLFSMIQLLKYISQARLLEEDTYPTRAIDPEHYLFVTSTDLDIPVTDENVYLITTRKDCAYVCKYFSL